MPKLGCLGSIAILLAYWILGTLSVIEILSWFGKSIPVIGCFIIGLFAGETAIPIAIIGHILRACHVF